MPFVLALIGGFLALTFIGVAKEFFALMAGVFIGMLLGMLMRLKRRVAQLENAAQAADAERASASANAAEARRLAEVARSTAIAAKASATAPATAATPPSGAAGTASTAATGVTQAAIAARAARPPSVTAPDEAVPPSPVTPAPSPEAAASTPVSSEATPATPPPSEPAAPKPDLLAAFEWGDSSSATPAPDAVSPGNSASNEPAPTPAEVRQQAQERLAALKHRLEREKETSWTQPQPREPGDDIGGRVFAAVKRWFTEGNVPVKLGMLVLFVGVAALLKYAVDNRLVVLPIELRLAAVAATALGGLVFGWRQSEQRRAFALSLQGGAIGVLLLVVFAAYRLYGILPASVAFGLVVLLVAGSALLAILQHAVALAVLGFVGGYLAPVLISTGSGNHVALFSYYAILNAAVFGVAWVRPWRPLNLVGFGFTFIVGLMWGDRYYTPQHFATVEPFLILFFLFYVGIAVLYALRQPEARRGLVDGTLTFSTPLIAFGLQAAMVEDRYLLAYSALAVAVLYGVLFRWLWRRPDQEMQARSFAALAVGFATLAVPLALSAQWTSTTWALEGVALVWLGLRQNRFLPRIAGNALQLLAGLAWIYHATIDGRPPPDQELAVLNGTCLSALLLAGAGWVTAWLYERSAEARASAAATFIWGTLWWLVAGLWELQREVPREQLGNALVGFTALTMLLGAMSRRVLAWTYADIVLLGGFVVALPLVLGTHESNHGALENGGWIAWLAFLVVGRVVLAVMREPRAFGLALAHIAYLALLPLLLGLQLVEWTHGREGLGQAWVLCAAILPLLVQTFLLWRRPALLSAPLQEEFPDYAAWWFAPAALVLGLWWLIALGSAGSATPVAFIPLLNPLELMQLAVLVLLAAQLRDEVFPGFRSDRPLPSPLLLAAFVLLTVATLRAVHHFTGAPWSSDLLDSNVAQTSLTVVWSVVGVLAWIAGSRRGSRPVWLAGAVLMGVVLAKLVLIDRQYTGNIPGIVSFIAVGLLLTVVGYFAPSPPREDKTESTA